MKRLLLGSLLLALLPASFNAVNSSACSSDGARLCDVGTKRLLGGGGFTGGGIDIGYDLVNYRTPDLLHRVGKGVDVNRSGFYAYDSEEIQFDVFDRDYLNSLYRAKGNFMNPAVTTTTVSDKASTFDSLGKQVSAQSSAGIFAQASLPYVEATLSASAGFSTSSKLADDETSFIFNLRYLNYTFDYELPSFAANKNDYLQHLSADYLEDLSNAITASNRGGGLYSYFALFEKYGTDILWKGGYGGACDVLYTAHSRTVNLEEKVSESISASLGAKAENAVSGHVTSEYSLADILNVSHTEINEKLQTRFVGGKAEYIGLVYTLNAVSNRANAWINSIRNSPSLVSFRKTEPIWKMLPSELEEYSYDIQRAVALYNETETSNLMAEIDRPLCSSSNLVEEYVHLNTGEQLEFGDYWDRTRDQEFEFNLQGQHFYNAKNLKKAGFKKVRITPTFKLKEIRPGTTAKISFYYGKNFGKVAKTSNNIDLSDDKEHFVTRSELEINMSISDFISQSWIRCNFATNDNTGVFWWTERGAKVTDLKFEVQYTK